MSVSDKGAEVPPLSISVHIIRISRKQYTGEIVKILGCKHLNQSPVFSLGVSQHMHALNNKSVKIWTQLVIEVARD